MSLLTIRLADRLPNHIPFRSQTGASSIRYVRFAQPQNITFLSADQDHTGDHLAEFENLEVLECNQIEEFNL